MTTHHHLKLVRDESTNEQGALSVPPSSAAQACLPFDVCRRSGVAILGTAGLDGQAFRGCIRALQPGLILDARSLPRLDFVGYSRSLAFQDFREHGVKYAMLSMPSAKTGATTAIHAFEQAGVNHARLMDALVLMLVDDNHDASAILNYLTQLFSRVGWTGLDVWTEVMQHAR